MATREDTINTALGEVLADLRKGWTVRAEETGGVLKEGGRPDVLVLESASWPVVVEAERENHASAEQDAVARLGKHPVGNNFPVETAIALVYPPELHDVNGAKLRAAIRSTDQFEYALYTASESGIPDRLPERGWLTGGVRDLAMLIHRAAAPALRVDRLVTTLEHGVSDAADAFESEHGERSGAGIGPQIAEVLGQSDDQAGQTRRMAMAVLINALIFHESLAQVAFLINEHHPVVPVHQFNSGSSGFDQQAIINEWEAILEVNYWPIFATAGKILHCLPTATANAVLQPLWNAAQGLIRGGVTRSHDLTGIIFQRLIADRKFLATYYTRPAAAALLAALALPADRPPRGSDWGDADAIGALQIGDFACGTGTLLSAAYQRVSLLHELHGGDPKALHPKMMKSGLHGLDVLNIAVHLTAAMLASAHPDTPFDGEALLTMPYGAQDEGSVAIGSLDLLASEVQSTLINRAAAMTAGGREPKAVENLVSQVGHDRFDLVIMNPPFTRPTNHEGEHSDVPNPAYAAFDTDEATQSEMADREKVLAKDGAADGNAGIASFFAELAHRKRRAANTVALVLPLSSMSGSSWGKMRQQWRSGYSDSIVTTVARHGSFRRSFSADTGIAECLSVHTGPPSVPGSDRRATFAVLHRPPTSQQDADLLGAQITNFHHAIGERTFENGWVEPLHLGATRYGMMANMHLPETGPWPLMGVVDLDLAQTAYQLARGRLRLLGAPLDGHIDLPIARHAVFSKRGFVHRDINGINRGQRGKPDTFRGPFDLRKLEGDTVPEYPTLWHHDAKRERFLIVEPDAEAIIRTSQGSPSQDELDRRAHDIVRTATRAHYNLDLQFNSQSLIVAITKRKCIGATAWPSVILPHPDDEYVYALWSNSSPNLLIRWWLSNKSQNGRGRVGITDIPEIPTLNISALSSDQKKIAEESFAALRGERFLPFDQIDEDPARAELDRRLLVDVLGLPPSLCEPDGPIDLLRRKLAQEPQIHGGKKSRVVFTDEGEKTEKRRDRD